MTEVDGRPVLGATERVTVAGLRGSTAVVAKVDTGASRSSIDTGLACEVGAGPIVGEKRFRSSTGSEHRAIVEVRVTVRGREHVVEANLADRSDLATDLRLGRSVLEGYLVSVAGDDSG